MDKKLFKKIFLFTYIDIIKIHKWIWIVSKKKYTLFKRILILLNAVNIVVYFISVYYVLLSVLFIITGVLTTSFTLLLTVPIFAYITILTLILERRIFKRKQLVKFNFSLINESNDPEEIRESILNLEEELRKYNKRKSKIIVILNAYIYHFVSSLNPKKNMKSIKSFFRNCSKILDEKDDSMFIKEIIIMNNKIKSQEEYKYIQDYLTGVTDISNYNENNLFSYLNKIDNYFYKHGLIKRVLFSLESIFERINKYINVIILILIILLTFFFPEKIRIILDIISKFK